MLSFSLIKAVEYSAPLIRGVYGMQKFCGDQPQGENALSHALRLAEENG